MDNDRKRATMDLLRRFGSDATLSVNSLTFSPGGSETAAAPSVNHFRALDDGFVDTRMAVLSDSPALLNNIERPTITDKHKIDLTYGVKEGPKAYSGLDSPLVLF